MPAFGSVVGTAGDGLTALRYAFVGGDTIVFADSDDEVRLTTSLPSPISGRQSA